VNDLLGPIGQLGILVHDLEEALPRYTALWRGAGPWLVYTYGPDFLPSFHYRGEPATSAMRIALSAGRPQIELIQPLGGGPSVYDGFEPGFHHVGVLVESIEDAMATMARAGYEAIQWGAGYGLDGDGGFAYFDTAGDLGIIVEAIEVPKRRREPELVWPDGEVL
jgi:hypothetical protein